jgi:hypothetical protein
LGILRGTSQLDAHPVLNPTLRSKERWRLRWACSNDFEPPVAIQICRGKPIMWSGVVEAHICQGKALR